MSEQDKTSVQKQLEWCIQEKNALREKLDFLSLVADRETESPPTLEKLQLPETALQKKQEESQEDVAQLTQKDCDAREDNMSDITVAETSLVQNKSAHTYTEIQAKHSRGKMPPNVESLGPGKVQRKIGQDALVGIKNEKSPITTVSKHTDNAGALSERRGCGTFDWNVGAGLLTLARVRVLIAIRKTELSEMARTGSNVNIQLSKDKNSHRTFQIPAKLLEKEIAKHPSSHKRDREIHSWLLYIDTEGHIYRRITEKQYTLIAFGFPVDCPRSTASVYKAPPIDLSSLGVLQVEYKTDREIIRKPVNWFTAYKCLKIEVRGKREESFFCNVKAMLNSFEKAAFLPRIMGPNNSQWEFFLNCSNGKIYKTAFDTNEIFQLKKAL